MPKFSVAQGRSTGDKNYSFISVALDLVVKVVLTMEIPTERKRMIAESLHFSTTVQYYISALYFSTTIHHYSLSKGFTNDKELINVFDRKLRTQKESIPTQRI